MIKKYALLFIFVISIIYGVYISIEMYYYTPYQYIYWAFYAILTGLFVASRIYAKKVTTPQLIAFLFISSLYFFGWLLIPHFQRFGIFWFATLCFLYAGLLLRDYGSAFQRVLFWLAVSFSAVNLVAVLFYIAERSLITRPLINTIFVSNSNESKEYFAGRVSVLHFVALLAFGVGVYFLQRRNWKARVQEKLNIFVFPLFALGFLISIFSGPIGALTSEYFIYLGEKESLRKMADAQARNLREHPLKIQSDQNSARKVMIIIGESLNRRFMSLYGYSENTTPQLVNLARGDSTGKLIYFNDIISPEAMTVPALRKILTNITTDNHLTFEKSVTVVDLFRQAGYETFWLSNQAPLGKHDTPNAVISSGADHVYFTASKNDIRGDNGDNIGNYYDSDLFDVFKEYSSKNNKNEKQVYFMHLMGCHWYYKDRYPPEFNIYKSTKLGDLNSYLNCVRYNDEIVAGLIKLAKEQSFDIVCYFSDHGEDLKNGHNQENYTKEMSTVPFMFYLSREYMMRQDSLVQALEKRRNVPAMSDNLFQILQTVSGFRSSLYNAKESFLTDEYVPAKRKVVDGKIAFD